MKYTVRTNCEYSLEVDADNAPEAIQKASSIPYDDWEKAWALHETEPNEETSSWEKSSYRPVDSFHDHLDCCGQCREQPFNLCVTGAWLLKKAAIGE